MVTIFLGSNDANLKSQNPHQHVPLQEYKQLLIDIVEYLMVGIVHIGGFEPVCVGLCVGLCVCELVDVSLWMVDVGWWVWDGGCGMVDVFMGVGLWGDSVGVCADQISIFYYICRIG